MANSGTAHVNDIAMYYETAGQGPALVLIHGWGFALNFWSAQIDALSSSYRVIAYDWRGMGRSSGGRSAYPFDALVDDLHGLLATLDVKQAILCGHSIGGSLVQSYCLKYPRDVAAAIIVDSNFPATELAVLTLYLQALGLTMSLSNPWLTQHLHTMSLTWRLLEPKFYAESWRAEHRAEVDAIRAQFLTNDPRALVVSFQAWANRPNLRGKVGAIHCPTLVVRGSEDGQVPSLQMTTLAREIKGAIYETLEGAGHCSPQQQPAAFNLLLTTFLNELGAGANRVGAPHP